MAAANGSFSSPRPATAAAATATTAPVLEKGVSTRLVQTHLAGCAGVRGRGPGPPRVGWRWGGGGWRRMAPGSALPVSLAHSAAGLRLTAHPGNRRPRECPPPPASLRA